jgi:RNA polymerase sigma-70 factor (ECF subfamily)
LTFRWTFNSYGCWKSNDISTVWDQEEELLDNPDFNVIMEECMNDLTEMEISRNIQILKREKTEAICQELEITTSIIGRLFIDPSCF